MEELLQLIGLAIKESAKECPNIVWNIAYGGLHNQICIDYFGNGVPGTPTASYNGYLDNPETFLDACRFIEQRLIRW